LAAIPLEEAYLFNNRYKKIRNDKTRNKRRLGNIITILNRVLKRAGIIKVGSRRSGKISVAWIKWLELLSNREDIFGLTTFARFCSERNIEPHQVTLDVWYDFVDETLHHSGVRKPRGTIGRVVIANHRARTKIHNWPLPEFSKLANPRTVSIPKGDLPTSFWQDIDTYMQRSRTPPKNLFDKNWPKQLSLDTLQRYRDVAWRTASAQVHVGRKPSEITSLASLLDLEWLKQAMTWFYHHAGDTFLKDHLNTAATWVSFADNHVHPPEEVTEALRDDIMKVVEKKLGAAQFSERNVQKLEQLSSPEIVDEFLFLPYQIMSEIKKKKVITVEDATEMMAAVGIELLLTTMIRRKNLADISLSKHFWPAKPTSSGDWALAIDMLDVKNKQPLRFKLSKPTIAMIKFYLKRCRPLLVKKPTDMMFLRTNGEPKGRVMMANLISRTIRRRLDLDINVHLFRHIGTMLYLDAHPGNFGVVQIMLGHTSDRTTQRFYARLQATQAIKHFSAAVLGARDDKIAKLKLA
jgi:integrase